MVQPRGRLGVLIAGLLPLLSAAATSEAASKGSGGPHAVSIARRPPREAPRTAWEQEFPGASRVRLVAARGGRVLLQSGYPSGPEGDQWTWRLHSVELESGKEHWRREASAWFAPLVDAGRLYLLQTSALLALDWGTGRKLWSTPAKGDLSHPLLARNGRVFYRERGGAVVAADGAGGHQLWGLAPPREFARFHPLAIASDCLYLQRTGAEGHYLAALDPATGTAVQEVRLERGEDLDYVVTALHWAPEQRRFFLQEVKTGAGIDFRSLRALRPDLTEVWRREHLGRFALAEGVLVCEAWKNVHNERQGLMALDAGNGRVLWERTEKGQEGHSVIGTLGNTVVIAQEHGKLRGLQPRTGREVWSLSVPFTHVRAAGDTLLVFSDGEAGKLARVSALTRP